MGATISRSYSTAYTGICKLMIRVKVTFAREAICGDTRSLITHVWAKPPGQTSISSPERVVPLSTASLRHVTIGGMLARVVKEVQYCSDKSRLACTCPIAGAF
jgi:hypothetical protein